MKKDQHVPAEDEEFVLCGNIRKLRHCRNKKKGLWEGFGVMLRVYIYTVYIKVIALSASQKEKEKRARSVCNCNSPLCLKRRAEIWLVFV